MLLRVSDLFGSNDQATAKNNGYDQRYTGKQNNKYWTWRVMPLIE